MSFDFTGKKILITGAGRGIGRALAKEVAKSGGEVYALSRTKETLDSLAKESARIYPIVADLSDWDGTRAVLSELEVMDGVVNNAAELVKSFESAIDCLKEFFDRALNVNLMGAINVIQMAGKKMVAAGKGGSIVNVSSVLALNPVKGTCYYGISKAGLDMVTKQFALELGPHQIRVNSINPTIVLTETLTEEALYAESIQYVKSITPLGRVCQMPECVDPIMYLLSDHSRMVSGTLHVVDGGMLL